MAKSDKELADELDARERLENRGYKKVACEKCGGIGWSTPNDPCLRCGGKGYHWQAPLMK